MNKVAISVDTAKPVPADGVILTRGDKIPLVSVTWFWKHWLAAGKVHVLAGAPGQGKTTLALAMAATFSSGGKWPDGTRCAPGSVLIWTGEDDPSDTLNPRFVGMAGNLARIHYVTGIRVEGEEKTFTPARDFPSLLTAAQAIGDVRLIVVDPIVSAVTGDGHKAVEVRQSLQPLVDLAGELGAAVLGITHLAKGSAGRDPTERVLGSISFAALARVVMLAAKVKGDDGKDKRVLVRSKSNLGPDDGGFQYHVEQIEVDGGIEASIVTWDEAIAGTARELLAEAETEPDQSGSALDAAQDFLCELLKDCATPTKTVEVEAKAAGISWASVRRASEAIGVQKKKANDCWYWSLPPAVAKAARADQDVQLAQDAQDFWLSNIEQVEPKSQDAHNLLTQKVEQVEQVDAESEVLL